MQDCLMGMAWIFKITFVKHTSNYITSMFKSTSLLHHSFSKLHWECYTWMPHSHNDHNPAHKSQGHVKCLVVEIIQFQVVDLYTQDNANGLNWNLTSLPYITCRQQWNGNILFDVIFEWRASFTRLNTQKCAQKACIDQCLAGHACVARIQDEGS